MALSDIFDAFERHIESGAIDLCDAANTESALSNLKEALALFQIRASAYTLTGVRLAQSISSVVLAGSGTFGVPGAGPNNLSNIAATLTATAPPSGNAFQLSLAVTTTGWTFDRTFPTLPDCQQLSGQVVLYTDSYLIGMPLSNAVFLASSGTGQALHLAGELQPFGALLPFADFLGSWPLRLEGTIGHFPASTTDLPAFDLIAFAPNVTFQIFNVQVRDVGVELAVSNDLDEQVWGRTGISVLNLVGNLFLGTIQAGIFLPLLTVTNTWRLLAVLQPGQATLINGLAQLADLFGIPSNLFLTPPGLSILDTFYLSEVEILMKKPKRGQVVPTLLEISGTIGSSDSWNPSVPFVCVRNVGTRWVMGWTAVNGITQQYLTGSLYGTITVGGERQPCSTSSAALATREPASGVLPGDCFSIGIQAKIPQFVITGQLQKDSPIPIGQALLYFFGGAGPATVADMKVIDFTFEADLRSQTYQAYATLSLDWKLDLRPKVQLTLQNLLLAIDVSQHSVRGGLRGEFLLTGGGPPGEPDPMFFISAEYAQSDQESGWKFRGALYPDSTLDLVALVARFLDIDPPSTLPQLRIEALSVEFATNSKCYAVSGSVVGRWDPLLFGSSQPISAEASVNVRGADGEAVPTGQLTGRFAINSFSVSVAMDLGVANPTYVFVTRYRDAWLSATLRWRGIPENPHRILTLQLGGATLGSILEYLVNLAAPTLGFELDAPWSVLNRVDLSRFTLTIDPTDNMVDLLYAANVDLVFMTIDSIGVRARKRNGEPDVELILTGRFLDNLYDTDTPLSWNVISDPPPAVPGQGNSLLDLRYLGVGQRVTLKPPLPDTVRQTLDRMRADMGPVSNPDQNPLEQSAIEFAPDSQWLIGLDASFLETLDLGIVFNDPRLYGLSIGLNGYRAGTLSGLRFEILYKKITDDIGMFGIELQLPEAFRHIELGEVSITLGVIVVEIYTNGNFLVDLGFPHQRNFDRSFTVQVFPFLGRGGIYFGLLNGATSRRVPAITNGDFAPVIELGLGLAVGVGKDVTVGPLSGGIFVEVEVMFQGALAWFNPSSNGVDSAKYYWVQGIAAMHGKLYGKIDFSIIKASVTIEAYAQASVALEAYKEALFALDVGVTVEAEVDLVLFTVSFSFEAHLNVSFTVGRDQPTPWVLASGQGAVTALPSASRGLLPSLRNPLRRARILQAEHLGRLGPNAIARLSWDPTVHVFTDSPRQKDFTLSPCFSITNVPVQWNGQVPPNSTPQYRAAFIVSAPNGVTPGARKFAAASQRSAHLSAQAGDTNQLTADTLIEAFLRWSICAVTGSPGNNSAAMVTYGQLDLLLQQMCSTNTVEQGFAMSSLATFFQTNLNFVLHGDPGDNASQIGGMAVPIPPVLSWASPQTVSVNFATANPVGPLYAWGVSQVLGDYFPLASSAGEPPPDNPANYESFATYVFRDWCLMLAKTSVEEARKTMSGWPVTLTSAASLQDIAHLFPSTTITYIVRTGDTISSVAAVLGESPANLEFLNPTLAQTLLKAAAGATISITLGVSPEIVAIDNGTAGLAQFVPLSLGDIYYQAQATDTLSSIAGSFHLPNAAALFQNLRLAGDTQLLNPGTIFTVPASTFTPPANFTQVLAAAVFFVRFSGRTHDVPNPDWYGQTIFDLNATGALANWNYDQPIPQNITLQVPGALNDPDPAHAVPYTTLAGETLLRIGAALSLAQNYATSTDQPFPEWPAFRNSVQQLGGNMLLPATPVAILDGESVNLLGERTVLCAGNIAALLQWIDGAAILSPLASLLVPGVTATTGTDGLTLSAIATRFGLSVADLAGRIAGAAIFMGSTTDAVTLRVVHLPVQSIDALVGAVLAGEAPARISAMCSRFLLAGLRLPAPEQNAQGHTVATGPATSLYDLTAQQFASPVPDPDQPTVVRLQLTVTVNTGATWVELASSTTVGQAEDVPTIAARTNFDAAILLARNRALALPGRLQPGIVIDTGSVLQLVFSYTNAHLAEDYPATGFAVLPSSGPAPLSLAARRILTYGLDHRIELQSPVALPIPQLTAPLTGNASLWPFPESLLARARTGTTTPYDLLTLPPGSDGGGQAGTLLDSTYATLIPFVIRRLNTQHVYELVGVDTVNRQRLLRLHTYVKNETAPPLTQAFLLAPPSPGMGNPSGLTVLLADGAKTYLIQTNQSTETLPGASSKPRGPADVAPSSQYFSDFAALAPFLLLLWEGSTVGGAGYYLGYSSFDGKDFPPGIFDERGNATLYLLALVGSQQTAFPGGLVPQGRQLLPFNNAAIVAPGLDAAATTLYAESADDSEWVQVATVEPGNIGLSLTLPQPTIGANRSQSLFSLVTYATTGASFQMPVGGFPVTPRADDGTGLRPWDRIRRERWLHLGRTVASLQTGSFWAYEQVLPIARFAPSSVTPPAPALPDPTADPYRGIGNSTTATVQLGFADVAGNITAPPASGPGLPPGGFTAPVGYTDSLLGLSSWPAVTSHYALAPSGNNVTLSVTIEAQPGAATAGPGQSVAAAKELTTRQLQKYTQLYFQLAQPGVTAALLTSLLQDNAGHPLATPIPVAPFWQFATANLLAIGACAALQPVVPAVSLGDVVTSFGVSFAQLASANANQQVTSSFGTVGLTIPAFLHFSAGATANGLLLTLKPGWPKPASGPALLELAQNAMVLPLRSGAILVIPATDVTVLLPLPPAKTEPLAKLAALHHTAAGLLAEDSASLNVLANGFVFTMDGLYVAVGQTINRGVNAVATFNDVQQAFSSVGVIASVAEIAVANGDAEGMLAAGAHLVSRHYIAVDRDTLGANQSGASLSDLATLNADTADLFDAGALVFFGNFAQSADPGTQTLAEYADRYGCPPQLLLAANAALVPPAQTTFTVPGNASIPSSPTAWVPYIIPNNATLDGIVALFQPAPGAGTPALNLAAANEFRASLIAGGQTVTVHVTAGTFSTPTQAGDSFHSVLLRLQAQSQSIQLSDVVTAIEGTAGYLAQGVLMVCPPAKLPTGGGPNGTVTVQAAADAYGVSAVAFAQINAAVQALVAGNVTLNLAVSSTSTVTITTKSQYTFNAILTQFEVNGAVATIADILAQNRDANLLNGNAAALLPAVAAVVSATLPGTPGLFAQPMFPLTVALRIARPQATINPEFVTPNHDGPVEQADSFVSAPISPQGGGQASSVDAFAATLRAAYPSLWLASGKLESTAADLWVADFGSTGIAQVTVAPGVVISPGVYWPRFFALRPLYNQLVNRRVNISTINDQGQLVGSTATSMQNIDVETWARRFLADIDLFLSAPYSTGVYANPDARTQLDSVLKEKAVLSAAIPRGLAPILNVADPKQAAGLVQASAILEQQLAITLSQAYATAAILQYDATVSSAWTQGRTLKPARLSGKPDILPLPRTADDPLPSQALTLTNAKTDLTQTSSFVTFLLRVPDPSYHRSLTLNLNYSFENLEFNVTPVIGAHGFVASDWLTFVPALPYQNLPTSVAGTLGICKVPIPLRAYPALPVIAGQSAKPFYQVPERMLLSLADVPLDQVALWNYRFAYSHEHAEQDEVLISASFNISLLKTDQRILGDEGDVATPLARYNSVANRLWALLSGFADPNTTIPASTLANASQSFAILVHEVATAWNKKQWTAEPNGPPLSGPRAEGGPDLEEYSFAARISYRTADGITYFDKYTLIAQQAKPGPGGNWPLTFCRAVDGSLVELERQAVAGATAVYQFPLDKPIQAGIWPQLTLEWTSLNVALYQNARGSLSVRRNQKLLEDTDPATTSGFVYQSPAIQAPSIVTALATWPQEFDITLLGATLPDALTAAFQTLFATHLGLPATIGIFIGLDLVTAGSQQGESLVRYLPLSLYPNQTLSATTGTEIQAAITAWRATNPPALGPATRYAFSLTVYSQMTVAKQPLLVLDRLVYRTGA